MAFRFREGDRRIPYSSSSSSATGDGFFPTQALLARQREIEKERIREEILAAEELAHRRELEQEVRRELELERNFALLHERWKFSHVSEPRVPLPTRHLPPIQEARVLERVPLPPLRENMDVQPAPFTLEVRMDDSLALASRVPEMGVSRLRGSGPGKRFDIPFMDTINQSTTFSGNPAKPTLAGKKRKVVPAEFLELPSLAAGEKSNCSQWKCDLCQVSCTSKTGLMDHMVGKKHTAKEEQAKGEKGGATAIKNKESPPLLEKKGGSKAKKKKNVETQPKQQMQKNGDKAKERFQFWCEHCKIGSPSACVFESHLKGKKHLLWLAKRSIGKIGGRRGGGRRGGGSGSGSGSGSGGGSGSGSGGGSGVAAAEEDCKVEEAEIAEEVGEMPVEVDETIKTEEAET